MLQPMWKSCCVALGTLLFWVSALAQAAPPVQLDVSRDEFPLAGHLEWLEDASAQMTLAQVQEASGWDMLPGMPNAGFTRSAVWLRFTVIQPVEAPSQWRLSIDDTQLDEAQLYTPLAQGNWQTERAGRVVPRGDWPLATRVPTFDLQLSPGRQTIYIRLQSQHTVSHPLRLHSINGFLDRSNFEGLAYGVYFGIFSVAVVLQLAFLLVGRDVVSAWYLLYTLVLLMTGLLRSGYLQMTLDPSGTIDVDWLTGFSILAPGVVVRLSAVWLELHRHLPRLNVAYQGGAYALSLLCLGLALADHHVFAMQANHVLTLLWLVLSLVLGWWLWRRGTGEAGYYLLVFGAIEIGVLTRFLRNMGWLPVNFYTDHAIFIGTAIHLVFMSLYFIQRYSRLQTELRVERRAREEQNDFVGMVSHEFRTPLAIINTSIQQLAANMDAPAEKSQQRAQNIRDAVQRMTLLLDDYLSLDRMDSATQAVRPRPCDFYEVIEDAASDWPVGRIRIRVQDLPTPFICDPDLMRIVLRNLLANAVRHSPDDTMVALEARGQAGGGLLIRVQDWGDGVPPDELPRLFQRYFRGRASQGKPGAGLGLHLVQRIVQSHEGGIVVQSSPGEGSIFTITLPQGRLATV